MDLMQLRRSLMMKKEQGGLPAEYKAVEYLESTGTQYIDTGFIPKFYQTDKFVLEFSVLTSSTVIVFGTDNYNPGSTMVRVQLPSLQYRLRADLFSTNTYFGYCTSGEKCTLLYQNRSVTCVGSTIATSERTENNIKNLYLFAQGPSELSTMLIGRIYKCTYESNGVTSLNLIPCVRKSDDEPGMYDTVSKTFYTNAGTGKFIIPT